MTAIKNNLRLATRLSFLLFASVTTVSLSAQIGKTPNQTYVVPNSSYTFLEAAGDINNDGFDDVFVSNSSYSLGGLNNRGSIYLMAGSETGLSNTAIWSVLGDSTGIYMGGDVETGDINFDGLTDIVVSTNTPYYSNNGKVWIFLQTVSGFSTTPTTIIYGVDHLSRFGNRIELCDFNSDNYSDLIVSAPQYDVAGIKVGKILIYFGGPTGISTTPGLVTVGAANKQTLGSNILTGDFDNNGYNELIATYYTGQIIRYNMVFNGSPSPDLIMDDTLVYSSGVGPGFLAFGGDINGDGFDDLVMNSSASGFAMVVVVQYGSPTGLSNYEFLFTTSKEYGSAYGSSFAPVGDINGDGKADILVGETAENSPATDGGRAYIYYGNSINLSEYPDWSFTRNIASDQIGKSCTGIGDINGDGYNDVLFGSSSSSTVLIFFGSSDGLDAIGDELFTGKTSNNYYGYSVDQLGDFNNDNFDDFVIGSPGFSTNNGKGVEYIKGNSTEPLPELIYSTSHIKNGYQVKNAGDINGDGKSDLLTSGYICSDYAPYIFFNNNGFGFDSSWFTCSYDYNDQPYRISVNGAGDVNNDGFDDFLVGGLGKSYTENNPTASTVRLFYGNTNMLYYDTTYVYSVDSNIWVNIFTQDSCDFGRALAPLGDINGDNFDDFIVSAPRFDNGENNEGRTYIYLGGEFIPSYTPYWTFESNQVNAQSGYSIGTNGDINGDGRNDLIIGAPFYDNGETDEGVVFVFLGTPLGFNLTPSFILEMNQAGANFGISVDFAGDYNNDGFDDIVVGANKYDGLLTDAGGIFLFLGNSGGISTIPFKSEFSNQSNSNFGFSVSGAGDVNNDGYDDLIAGAYSYNFNATSDGIALLFYGEAALCTAPEEPIVEDVTYTSANLVFAEVAEAASYNVSYKLSADPFWTVVTTTEPVLALTGLIACNEYFVKLQIVCDGGSVSDYSDTVTFTTVCPCAIAPSGLYADNLTTTTAKLHWNIEPYATKYKVTYRKIGSPWTTINATTNFKNISGLTPGATYQWKVKSVCGAGLNSPYSSTLSFVLPMRSASIDPELYLSITPNPNNGNFMLEMVNFRDESTTVRIFDITGAIVLEYNLLKPETISVSMGNSAGCYFVQITQGGTLFTEKIIIQ